MLAFGNAFTTSTSTPAHNKPRASAGGPGVLAGKREARCKGKVIIKVRYIQVERVKELAFKTSPGRQLKGKWADK